MQLRTVEAEGLDRDERPTGAGGWHRNLADLQCARRTGTIEDHSFHCCGTHLYLPLFSYPCAQGDEQPRFYGATVEVAEDELWSQGADAGVSGCPTTPPQQPLSSASERTPETVFEKESGLRWSKNPQ